MRLAKFTGAVIFMAWGLSGTLAKPLDPTSSSQIWSQANSSGLDVHPEFKVEVTADCTVPIVSEEIYRVAIHMMYDVTGFSLAHPWLARGWSSTVGTSDIHLEHKDFGGKDPSHLYTQYVIWGLNHLMLSMYLSGQYCQSIAVLKWRGAQVGAIYVAKRAALGLNQNIQNQTDILQTDRLPERGSVGDDEDVEVSIMYQGSTPIDRQLIYLTATKAMGEAAEIGLNRPVQSLFTQGIRQVSWKLVSGTKAFTGVLKPSHSRIAVIKTLAVMLEDHKFQKTMVWVKVDGRNTAVGGFTQG